MSALDDILQLEQPLKKGGIAHVNFFNGRLLASKDLTREQAARREADTRLGLALGEGVAFGLDVLRDTGPGAPGVTSVRVKAGLAVNRLGQTLRLTEDASIALTRQFDAGPADRCVFRPCSPLLGGTYVIGAGLYVLTVAPGSVADGKAPSNGLDPLNVRCSTDANVEGVQFRLLSLTQQMLVGLDLGGTKLRNAIAHQCFGAGIQSDWFADLTTAQPRQDDLLEQLRAVDLDDQDVPLALLYFTGASRIEFIDNWAVKRPLHHPESSAFAALVQGRRPAVGHAMFLQFQAHIAELGAPFVVPAGVTARSHFRHLPPVGIITVAEESTTAQLEATSFFSGLTYRGPEFINAARVETLVRDSLAYPPIDTNSGEFIWLYRVAENRRVIDSGTVNPKPRSYIIFSSGHMPYCGDAQFDTARWSYSNYALAR